MRSPNGVAAGSGEAPDTAALLDAFFAWFYRTFPVSATFIGVHDHDHRLPDFTDAGLGDARAEVRALRRRLRSLPQEPGTEPRSAAGAPPEPGTAQVDRLLLEGVLDVLDWELDSLHFAWGNPCLYTGEAIFGVVALLLRPFAPLETRLESAVERLRAISGFLAAGRSCLRLAPRPWIERAVRECDGALALLERGLALFLRDELGAPSSSDAPRGASATWPRAKRAEIPPDRGGLQRLAASVLSVAAEAADAFRRYRADLTEALEGARSDPACGGDALELLLRRGHFLEMDASAVLELGREHLARADSRLAAEARALGAGGWREALGIVADRHPEVDGYYEQFGRRWREVRAAAEAHGLVTWPEYPIRFVPQPRWAREAAPFLYFLFYRAPAAFDRVPVVDYLVPPIDPDLPPEEQRRRLRAANDSVILLNHVIHHGGLGHHVQNWFAYHRSRSRIGRIAAVDCASRIALFCGGTMAEGWAGYAVDLMEEAGFLSPLDRLAQAHTRLRIAARAVADVQLHTGAWSVGEAAAFYREQAALAPEAAYAEAVKNSMFPGTALMYLVGTEQIRRLREASHSRPGFTLRAFHDELLSWGSIPVALIGRMMSSPRD